MIKDLGDQVMIMDKSLTSAMMNTECEHPIIAVISLSKILCELLIELGDDDEKAVEAFRDTLKSARNGRVEVH
jgi:hypothetical protein